MVLWAIARIIKIDYSRTNQYLHRNPFFTSNGQELVRRGQLLNLGDWSDSTSADITKSTTKAQPPIPPSDKIAEYYTAHQYPTSQSFSYHHPLRTRVSGTKTNTKKNALTLLCP